MRILVTGGAGFIGSNLVERLASLGHYVRVIDDLSTGRRGNLKAVEERVVFLEDDIRGIGACLMACAGIDVVFHEAALGSVPRSVKDPTTLIHVNVLGTVNMLDAAVKCGVRRFVYASSSSIYGGRDGLLCETMKPDPKSPYAVGKLAAEQLCGVFWKVYGLPTVSLRYFNVFGPRQSPEGPYAAVIPKFVQALREGRRPIIEGDGKQTRDFTHVDNIVQANLLAGLSKLPDSDFGKAYNVGCSEATSIRRLASLLARICGKPNVVNLAPERTGDVKSSLAHITKASLALGYSPAVQLEEGLKRYVDWLDRA